MSHVVWAQPNYRAEASLVPNDPFFSSAGAWGQTFGDLWALERIGVEEAWDTTLGAGIVVAVVDTGLDYDHPDIAANVWVNPGEDLDGDGVASDADRNGIDDDGNGFVDDLRGFDFASSVDADLDGRFDGPGDKSDADPFDDNGHGTHVAGTIAAVADNGIGIAGVAPGARIMALKGLSATGQGTFADLAPALVYAVENGADVINASWSCSDRCPSNPLMEETLRFVHGAGVVYVTSAGNKTDDVIYYSPENMRESIVVAATREDDSVAPFSNTGFLVDVAAPGATTRFSSAARLPTRGILSLLSAGAPATTTAFGLLTVVQGWLPYHLALLAEIHLTAGRVDEALRFATDATELCAERGERWYEAELHRLKGELTLRSAARSSATIQNEAEACFQKALEIAAEQSARSWQLRASTSLSRLWQRQGKKAEARQLLSNSHDWFTEGFDTRDLQEAKALLEELG